MLDELLINPEHSKKPPVFSEDTVSEDAVMSLISALSEPAMHRPELSNLGITSKWLGEHADDALEHVGALGQPNSAKQQEYFRKSFTDLDLIQKVIPEVIGAHWTDDDVWAYVTVKFKTGPDWTAETTSQPPFMLPWKCNLAGRDFKTYNADLSRSLSELLPIGAVNQKRLSGEGLDSQLYQAVGRAINKQWREIGAEDVAGPSLDLLRTKYTIRRSEVSDYNSLTYGLPWEQNGPRQTNLDADVRLASFPSNLTVATAFPIEDGKAVGVDTFLQVGKKYEQLVLRNPWIMASLRKHPELGAWLMFVKDSSMSEKALRIFSADMQTLGRDDLALEVSSERLNVALLNYYGSYLILFPDHHAIIWRWEEYRDMFPWPASALTTKYCTDYNTSTGGCVAAVVGADGKLQR